jgi:hypothetical protein
VPRPDVAKCAVVDHEDPLLHEEFASRCVAFTCQTGKYLPLFFLNPGRRIIQESGGVVTTPQDPAEQLAHAERMDEAMRRRGRWYARYLAVFAAGQFVIVPIALLGKGVGAAVLLAGIVALLVGALTVYAARQPMALRSSAATRRKVMTAWVVAYGITIALGVSAFQANVPFAFAGALIPAAPLALGVWHEMRQTA